MSALLCFSFVLQVAYCQVRVKEVVYAWLGSHVTLECRAETREEINQITWEMQVDGTSRSFLTYRNDTGPMYQMALGRRVNFKGDGYKDGSIQILNVTLTDEGIFKCVFTTFPSGTIEGKTQLQVMALPTVRQELTQDIRTPCFNKVSECLVFSAKPAAEIQWITHGINYTSKEEEPIIHSNGTTSKRSRLYMMPTPQLYGHEVLCFVSQPKIPREYQKNVTVNKTLTNIQFPPQKVHIEVLKNDKEVLQLLCKSDANPRPKYNWKRVIADESEVIPLNTNKVTSATLSFTDVQDGLYICEAANDVGVNQGYIYMYPSKSAFRCRLGFLISIIIVGCFAILCAGYTIKSRLLKREDDKTFINKRESIEDNAEDESERDTARKEEAQVGLQSQETEKE